MGTGWGYSAGMPSIHTHLGVIHIGLPVLVLCFFLAIPAWETRASRLGLTGSMACYALHIPILCFQQSFRCVRDNFSISTAVSVTTSLVLLHLPIPPWILRLGGWSSPRLL